MNNKGQTLVIFIVVLPILLLLLTIVIDLGFLYIEKRSIDNDTYDAVLYYLENKNIVDIESKTKNLLNSNIENCEIKINDNDNFIEITVSKEYKGLYSIISKDTSIEVTYKGIKENNKIIKG